MNCLICHKALAGRQSRYCGKSCAIQANTINRRQAGTYLKANMAPEAYARRVANNLYHTAKSRAQGRHHVYWHCVQCGKNFKVHKYNAKGYWCSNTCFAWWNFGVETSKSKELVKVSREPNRITVVDGGWFMAGYCQVCKKDFASRYADKTCSDQCKTKYYKRSKIKFTPGLVRRVCERDNWTCWICNLPVPPNLTYDVHKPNDLYRSMDHVVPKSLGGTHDENNLRLAHFGCNRDRGAPPTFL